MPHMLQLGACPECGGDMYQSRRRGLVERVFLRVLLIQVKRCHRCQRRFYCPPILAFHGWSVKSDRSQANEKQSED